MISAIELKKYVAGAGIFGVIIGKLRHKMKPCLIILLKVEKSSEIDFYCIILSFGLPVCLGVESSKEFSLDA